MRYTVLGIAAMMVHCAPEPLYMAEEGIEGIGRIVAEQQPSEEECGSGNSRLDIHLDNGKLVSFCTRKHTGNQRYFNAPYYVAGSVRMDNHRRKVFCAPLSGDTEHTIPLYNLTESWVR